MPARNTIKTYTEDTYYHIYNRGVEKRSLFLDENDYLLFLHLLKIYLSPPQKTDSLFVTRRDLVRPRPARSLSEEVQLSAYCLMPNHFHLLLLQKTKDGMTKLMRRISTTYAMYFNEKYDRVGTLFQGPYKAVNIDSEHYLLHLSRYIHLNPAELVRRDLVSYPYSSYPYYLGQRHAEWIDPRLVLSYFHSKESILGGKINSYQDFVESYQEKPEEILGSLTLE